jgi:hypothetical protein
MDLQKIRDAFQTWCDSKLELEREPFIDLLNVLNDTEVLNTGRGKEILRLVKELQPLSYNHPNCSDVRFENLEEGHKYQGKKYRLRAHLEELLYNASVEETEKKKKRKKLIYIDYPNKIPEGAIQKRTQAKLAKEMGLSTHTMTRTASNYYDKNKPQKILGYANYNWFIKTEYKEHYDNRRKPGPQSDKNKK